MTTRPSSRAGRFKKKLVPQDQLVKEAPLIEALMAPLQELYCQKKITAAEFAALYVVNILTIRFPHTWPGSRRPAFTLPHEMHTSFKTLGMKFGPNVQRRLEGINSVGELLANFALKSTPEAVNRALLSWSSGAYPLELMFRVPSPEEVLEQQTHGRRCVTILIEASKTQNYILGERDTLSFTMHDLIHADHFYHNNSCYQGQLGLYGLLSHCLRERHFEHLMREPRFKHELEYLISDMNAYAIHLLKCLKAALIHYHPQGHSFFHEWSDKIKSNEEEFRALMELNTPVYVPASLDHVLLNMLDRWKVK